MWTEPEHFSNWDGPTGASLSVATMDVRVGGARHVCMELDTPNGPMQMSSTGESLEVAAPERLVYTESMSDEHGNPTSAEPPTEVHVDLAVIDPDRTRMVMTHLGIPPAPPRRGRLDHGA